MELVDKDLLSIQEVRILVKKAKNAQQILNGFNQKQLDCIVEAMANAALENSEKLAKMAVDDTGFGNWRDKVVKNYFASHTVYESIKNMKTVGILKEDTEKKMIEIGVPVGIIAALIPSTNPTSTVIYKALISLKAGNAIIFSPHPKAVNCIRETVQILREAAIKAGCPEDAISTITNVSLPGTDELMKHKDVSLILATGGSAMVKAAYSSGTPAIGVGPGNGPAFIERSADIPTAVRRIINSKTFDNGTICASEQSVVVEECIKDKVMEEFARQGAYFLPKTASQKLEKLILRANGTMNPQIVGKTAKQIAEMAYIIVPENTKVLIAEETRVGKNIPYSREKLAPILAFYTEKNWEDACERCIEILNNEGAGHTMSIHSENLEVIKQFALKKPVSRLLVNTSASVGGIGATTNLQPALTLGCGAVGGGSTSDNVGPLNLINIRRIAGGVVELEEIKKAVDAQMFSCEACTVSTEQTRMIDENYQKQKQLVETIVFQVLEKLK